MGQDLGMLCGLCGEVFLWFLWLNILPFAIVVPAVNFILYPFSFILAVQLKALDFYWAVGYKKIVGIKYSQSEVP